MKKLFILLSAAITFSSSFSQNPTWENSIACLVYTHCANCHNPNGIAPFSLLNYSSAFEHRSAIASNVTSETMPPYHADRSYQHYAGERYLTQEEINLINTWVTNNSPAGDTTLAPVPPQYTGGSPITSPDFSARIPDYTVPLQNGDLYRCFVISNPFVSSVYISGMDVIPGNRSIVHHVLVFQDTSSTPVNLDNADSEPGYTNFGGIGSNSAKLIGGWVPGSQAYYLPGTMGIKISPGSRIVVQIHYPYGAAGKVDSTRVLFKYNTNTNVRSVNIQPILNHLISITDGPLSIPADSVKTFHEEYLIPANLTLLSVAPHSHLVCTQMQAFGVTSTNDTIPFVKIDDWDFHWQGAYPFKQLIKIPAGTTLHGIAKYDNTSNNPRNPSTPPQNVTLGEATTDEMMLFYFSFLLYQPGDENMVIDTSTEIAHYSDCAYLTNSTAVDEDERLSAQIMPNPASALLLIILDNRDEADLTITDLNGKQLLQFPLKRGNNNLNISAMAQGMYLVQMRDRTTGTRSTIHKLIKN